MFVFVYLDLLRLEDLPSAVSEAQSIAEMPDVPALVLSACINILAAWAEQASDDQFDSIAQQVLAWCRRFDQAPISIKRGRRSLLVLLQSGTCPPSSGPNLSGSTGIPKRPTTLSRGPDTRRSHRAPDL